MPSPSVVGSSTPDALYQDGDEQASVRSGERECGNNQEMSV